jgi:hypothetical protein
VTASQVDRDRHDIVGFLALAEVGDATALHNVGRLLATGDGEHATSHVRQCGDLSDLACDIRVRNGEYECGFDDVADLARPGECATGSVIIEAAGWTADDDNASPSSRLLTTSPGTAAPSCGHQNR